MREAWAPCFTGKARGTREEIPLGKVVGAFPSPDSVIRLIGSILMDMNEEWITGNCYLNLSEFEVQVPESKLSFCPVDISAE